LDDVLLIKHVNRISFPAPESSFSCYKYRLIAVKAIQNLIMNPYYQQQQFEDIYIFRLYMKLLVLY